MASQKGSLMIHTFCFLSILVLTIVLMLTFIIYTPADKEYNEESKHIEREFELS